MDNRGKANRYSPQFRSDAVALVRQGATQKQVCRDLGVSKSALHQWLHAADAVDQGLPADTGGDPRVRELIRRNRLLEMENEVLRQASAYLSQAYLPKK